VSDGTVRGLLFTTVVAGRPVAGAVLARPLAVITF